MRNHSDHQQISPTSPEYSAKRTSDFTAVRNLTLMALATFFGIIWVVTHSTLAEASNATYEAMQNASPPPKHGHLAEDRERFIQRLTEEVSLAHADTEKYARKEIARMTQRIHSKANRGYIPWVTSFSTGMQLRALSTADNWNKTFDYLLNYNLSRSRREVDLVRRKYHELVISPSEMRQQVRWLHQRAQRHHKKVLVKRIEALNQEFGLQGDVSALVSALPTSKTTASGLKTLDTSAFETVANSSPSAMRGVGLRVTQLRAIGDRALAVFPVPRDLDTGQIVLATLVGTSMIKGTTAASVAGATAGLSLSTLAPAFVVDPVTACIAAGLFVTWFGVEHMQSKKSGAATLHQVFNRQFRKLRQDLMHTPSIGVMPAIERINGEIIEAAKG